MVGTELMALNARANAERFWPEIHFGDRAANALTREPLKNYLFLKNLHQHKRIFKTFAKLPVIFHFSACNLPFWQITGGLPLGQQARFHA